MILSSHSYERNSKSLDRYWPSYPHPARPCLFLSFSPVLPTSSSQQTNPLRHHHPTLSPRAAVNSEAHLHPRPHHHPVSVILSPSPCRPWRSLQEEYEYLMLYIRQFPGPCHSPAITHVPSPTCHHPRAITLSLLQCILQPSPSPSCRAFRS